MTMPNGSSRETIASDAARYLGDGTTSLSEVLRVVTS